MKMNIKRKYVLIGLISLIIVLVVGYSFVHFSFKEEQKNPNSDIKTDYIEVEYTNGKDIKISNSKPGDSDRKEFRVKVTQDNKEESAKYRISLVVKNNTFEKNEGIILNGIVDIAKKLQKSIASIGVMKIKYM